MKVENYIPAKDPIKIEISIQNNNKNTKKENQKIRRLLNRAVISCEKYKLIKFKNGNYYLEAN